MHGYDERVIVKEYSVRKINSLFEAALRNEEVQNRLLGTAVRVGFNANQHEFKRWIDEVNHG
jgi:hypothetical protein